MNLIDIYRNISPNLRAICILLKLGSFSSTDHKIGHETSLNKLKKNWNHTKYVFGHNGIQEMKSKIGRKEKKKKKTLEKILKIKVN